MESGSGVEGVRTMGQEWEFFQGEKDKHLLRTGCDGLDRFLSYTGGAQAAFDFPRLIEIYGEAGSGKTQLSLQIALNAILNMKNEPTYKVLFITTQKHAHEQKIEAFTKHIINRIGMDLADQKTFRDNFLTRHITEVSEFDQYIRHDLNKLHQDCKANYRLRLVVIDNISSVVKQLEGGETYSRHRKDRFLVELYDSISHFMRQGIYVIAVNNLAANFKAFDEAKKLYKNVSSLGDLWTYMVTDKFELMKHMADGRTVRLMKTHFSKNGHKPDTLLEITADGMSLFKDFN